jgi:hypothetical protein
MYAVTEYRNVFIDTKVRKPGFSSALVSTRKISIICIIFQLRLLVREETRIDRALSIAVVSVNAKNEYLSTLMLETRMSSKPGMYHEASIEP